MWAEPVPMASVNLCGLIVLWQDYSLLPRKVETFTKYPESTSRNGRQKRQIANAVEWIRINAVYKPLVFTLTIPAITDYRTQNKNVSMFFENFRKNYDCQHYVWVREYQKNGRPHYHVVADVDFFDLEVVNNYWSGLWGVDAKEKRNWALRLNRKHNRFVGDSQRLCWYLCKYLGKSMADHEKGLKVRKFAISQVANKLSRPKIYFENEISEKLKDYDIQITDQGIGFAVPKKWRLTKRTEIRRSA